MTTLLLAEKKEIFFSLINFKEIEFQVRVFGIG